MFLEFYRYITSDFWVFVQTCIYLSIITGLLQKGWTWFVKLIRDTNKGK